VEVMKECVYNVREEKANDQRARRLSLSDRAQRTSLRLEGNWGNLFLLTNFKLLKYIFVD
jgi:hypothetical protein